MEFSEIRKSGHFFTPQRVRATNGPTTPNCKSTCERVSARAQIY
jgi:hypothetical protein